VKDFYFNLVLTISESVGVGSALEKLSLFSLILHQLIPLLLITVWRYGELMLQKYFQLPAIEMTLMENGENTATRTPEESPKRGPLYIKTAHMVVWLLSLYLVATGYIALFSSPSLSPFYEEGVIHYHQISPPRWATFPAILTSALILLFGIFMVIFVARKMKSADTEDRTSLIWCGVWLIVGSCIGMLANSMGEILFLGNGGEIVFMFSLLMNERERLKMQEDKTYQFLRLENSGSQKRVANKSTYIFNQ